MAIIYIDDQDFNPMEASLDVDALVNDLESDTAVSRTPVGGHILEYPRRSTPTIPPGFSAPATPRLLSEQLLRPLSRNASGITPAVPVIPVTPIRAPSPVKAKKDKAGADASNTQGSITSASADAAKTTDVGEPQAAASGKSSVAKTQQETPKKVEEKAVLNQKEIKSVSVSGAEASKSTVKPTVKTATPVKKTQNTATTDSAPPKENISITTPSVTSSKRQPPGKLDIAAAMRPSENEDPSTASSIKNELQPKNPRAISLASASSIPSSPALPSTGSPVKRSAPRTIRVVPTPKSENTPSLASAAASPLPQLPTVDKLRSRQASIASLNQPGTPVSEFLSDNASITSASISRASSPPIGGKVGTAPIRKKSKAQAKKERQERARQIAEEQAMAIEELVKSSDPEPVQAPIIGRKKKTKKPAASTPKIASPAVRSQPEPVSPKGTNQEDIENAEAKSAAASSSKNAQVTQVASSAPQNSLPSTDTKAPQALAEISKDKLQPTAQSIIADLQKTGELLSSTLEFFKPLSSSLAHATRASASASGHPSGDGKGDSRTLITPQGRFLWGLTKELEERALELERSIEECKGAARFRPKNLIPQTSPTKSKLKSKTTGQIQNQGDFTDMANFLLDQNEKFNAAMTESLNQASSSQNPNSKLDPTASLLSSASIPLPPVTSNVQMNARNLPALDLSRPIDPSKPLDVQKLPPVSSASPAVDPTVYLNHFVVPRTDSPSPNHTRQETDAIGGPPPSKPSLTANQISKATKAVADGGIMTQELENLGLMAADMLGGVVANSLEALVGAGLDPQQFQAALKNSGAGATLQNFDLATILGQVHAAAGGAGVGKRNVLGVEEAEQAMLTARKETEVLEKKLSALVKRNRRLVSGAGGGKA
ncbi:hypothetical protein GQ43DRAFT_469844 [Delitschia confertaspora ATCC 74209]|uniref:Uncharacterized protein n=1 Tax=Delitschia confertaspora ATCC 74209 TaxID=1513339 RepID=A0A9P4JUQ3_9PLEO|nr:hypothetical protein GQ43DRAFT_469844 [Delitschia confertaspora ATCC 74209]